MVTIYKSQSSVFRDSPHNWIWWYHHWTMCYYIIALALWWSMVSPTKLCWRYHSLPLSHHFHNHLQYLTCISGHFQTWTEWYTVHKSHFQMHFFEWQILYSHSNGNNILLLKVQMAMSLHHFYSCLPLITSVVVRQHPYIETEPRLPWMPFIS